MKKGLIIFASLLLLVVFGLITCSVTGMYKMYNVSTRGNEPALKPGSRFFASSLKDPVVGDFIVYSKDGMAFTHRLIASGGDVVEIKGGTVFVNGKDLDKNLKLKHAYNFTMAEIGMLSSKELIAQGNMMPLGEGNYAVFMEDSIARANIPSAIRWVTPENEPEKMIKEQYRQNWNKDFFGPYTVPESKMFVLGDNRDNSEDSRYLGCINASDVKGTVLK